MVAIGLLSGGLDSILATKLMLEQGVEVLGLNFITPFTNDLARDLGVDVRYIEIELGEEYLQIVRAPKYGYGKRMNPCIDCRIFMYRIARRYMEEKEGDFIFTGEVLGQRPMSQNKWQLNLIDKESGLEGLILRPLSAKLLEPTIPEIEGLMDREKLLDIEGKSRKTQIELAEKFGIVDYQTPAGGCKLTDPQFSKRLKDAFEHAEYSLKDIELLKYGRHFRLPDGSKIVVGRDEGENEAISNLAEKGDILLEVVDFPGPITLLRNPKLFSNAEKNKEDAENSFHTLYYKDKDIKVAASICARYSDCDRGEDVEVEVNGKPIVVEPMVDGELRRFIV